MVAAIAVVRKTLAEAKKASEKLFQGEVTVSKKECWLIGIILLLTGIAVGLINAPLTHGVSVSLFSHNWSNNGNNSPTGNAYKDTDELCKPIVKKEENGKEKADDARFSSRKKKKWIIV